LLYFCVTFGRFSNDKVFFHLPKFMVYYGFSPGFIISYLSTGQEIGWKERLRYDLYYVEWDVKPQLNIFCLRVNL